MLTVPGMYGSSGGGGTGGPDGPPLKSQKYRVSLQYWYGSPEKSQSKLARIQCSFIIGSPAKRHLNGISLEGRWWPAYSVIWIIPLLIKLKKSVLKIGPPLTKLSGSTHAWYWQYSSFCSYVCLFTDGSREGRGPDPTPWKIINSYMGFLSNTGPDSPPPPWKVK